MVSAHAVWITTVYMSLLSSPLLTTLTDHTTQVYPVLRADARTSTRSPPHVTPGHIAFASRHVTRPRVVRRGGNTARPTSRLPWCPGHPSSMLCSCPRHHAITSHHMHMCPAEPSHAPRLSGLRRLLRLLLRVPRLLRLHRCLELEDGWGPESSRNERTHARIRVRRNGGAVARGVIMRRTWLGILMPWT